MHTALLFLVSVSLLAPPNACCCWADAFRADREKSAAISQPFAATPIPAAMAIHADEDCACCKRSGTLPQKNDLGPVEDSTQQAPVEKEHAPICPVVRKLDRVRVASLTSFVDVCELLLEQPFVLESIRASQTCEAILIPQWLDGLARHLRLGVLLI